jgi:hypothetical protein
MIFSEAAGLNNSIYGNSQYPIKMMLTHQSEAFETESVLPKIFCMDETGNFAEKYTYETSLGNFQAVGEQGIYPESSFQEGYGSVIQPDEWKLQFSVTQTMIEDAKFGKVKQKAYGFMKSHYRTREQFGLGILNNGQATTMTFGANAKSFNIACADGLALFSGAHTSITGGTGPQSNYFSNPFSYDALCLGEERMRYLTDDDGNILDISPDTIIIPPKAKTLKLVLDAIGASEGMPNTTNNSFNFQYGRWNVIMSPYLTNTSGITAGTDTWYLADSKWNEMYEGLIMLDRIPLTVKSYVDEKTDANIIKGRARYIAKPNRWNGIAKFDPGVGTTLLS